MEIVGVLPGVGKLLSAIRDRKKSEKERKAAAHRLVEKLLTEFIYKWRALEEAKPSSLHDERTSLLRKSSENILSVAAEIGDIVPSRIVNEMRAVATEMRKLEPWIGGSEIYIKKVNDVCRKCDLLKRRAKRLP